MFLHYCSSGCLQVEEIEIGLLIFFNVICYCCSQTEVKLYIPISVILFWRASGNAAKLSLAIKAHYGPDVARNVAGRVPPRPLSGRWGVISNLEDFILKVSIVSFRFCLSRTLGGDKGSKGPREMLVSWFPKV